MTMFNYELYVCISFRSRYSLQENNLALGRHNIK